MVGRMIEWMNAGVMELWNVGVVMEWSNGLVRINILPLKDEIFLLETRYTL